jgi:hypothetical protein
VILKLIQCLFLCEFAERICRFLSVSFFFLSHKRLCVNNALKYFCQHKLILACRGEYFKYGTTGSIQVEQSCFHLLRSKTRSGCSLVLDPRSPGVSRWQGKSWHLATKLLTRDLLLEGFAGAARCILRPAARHVCAMARFHSGGWQWSQLCL